MSTSLRTHASRAPGCNIGRFATGRSDSWYKSPSRAPGSIRKPVAESKQASLAALRRDPIEIGPPLMARLRWVYRFFRQPYPCQLAKSSQKN
jgi:hypothetical protein